MAVKMICHVIRVRRFDRARKIDNQGPYNPKLPIEVMATVHVMKIPHLTSARYIAKKQVACVTFKLLKNSANIQLQTTSCRQGAYIRLSTTRLQTASKAPQFPDIRILEDYCIHLGDIKISYCINNKLIFQSLEPKMSIVGLSFQAVYTDEK